MAPFRAHQTGKGESGNRKHRSTRSKFIPKHRGNERFRHPQKAVSVLAK